MGTELQVLWRGLAAFRLAAIFKCRGFQESRLKPLPQRAVRVGYDSSSMAPASWKQASASAERGALLRMIRPSGARVWAFSMG